MFLGALRNYSTLKEFAKMPYTIGPRKRKLKRNDARAFKKLIYPLEKILLNIFPLQSRGDKPLQMTFEDQINALIYFHLEEHSSGRDLLQTLEEDHFARTVIAPSAGIKKSSFFEAINNRGLEQLVEIFQKLYTQATTMLPQQYNDLGDLISIDGSLVDAALSMSWADYRDGAKKAKVHVGFDLNHSIPAQIHLTEGKADERPFATQIIAPGQTGVLDRYYQCHKNFDIWQTDGKHFVCRIKASTTIKCLRPLEVQPGSIVFYDAIVLLGTPTVNQTEKQVRVVAYRVEGKNYWIATDRYDLSAEQIATIYRLRWNIEVFFGWWKRHLKVYHLIARSPHGVMVQILGGLITYLLLAIYCHEQYHERVSIKRIRQLRIQIQNDSRYDADGDILQAMLNINQDSIAAKT
jgi:hypothetical protein